MKLTLLSLVESSLGVHEVREVDVLQGGGTFDSHSLESDERLLLDVILSVEIKIRELQ